MWPGTVSRERGPRPLFPPGRATVSRSSAGGQGDGANGRDEACGSVRSAPQVAALVGGALVSPDAGGLGSVVPSAETGEVRWVSLAGWSAVAGVEVGVDVVLVAGARVDPAAGNTQCRSRRMTISRIHAGGSCSWRASPRPMSRTGWMVTWEWPTQSLILAMVAGPSRSTSPTVARSVSRSSASTLTYRRTFPARRVAGDMAARSRAAWPQARSASTPRALALRAPRSSGSPRVLSWAAVSQTRS